jgi:hypothetical protein
MYDPRRLAFSFMAAASSFSSATMRVLAACPLLYRRKLKLKATFESGSLHFSFKSCNQACFQLGC